jgi:hypothetical protein
VYERNLAAWVATRDIIDSLLDLRADARGTSERHLA